MTIQEAIKSGRPFRRPSFETYIICPKDRDAGLKWTDSTGKFWPREEDLLASDWELMLPTPCEVWIGEGKIQELFSPGARYYVEGTTLFRDQRVGFKRFIERPDNATVLTSEQFNALTETLRERSEAAASTVDRMRDLLFPGVKK